MNTTTPQPPALVVVLRQLIGAQRHAEGRALVIERQPDISYTLTDRVRQQRLFKLQVSGRTIATQVLNNLPRQVSQLLTTLSQVLQMIEARCALAEDSPARLPFCQVLRDEIEFLLKQHQALVETCGNLEARAKVNCSSLEQELNAVLEQLGNGQTGQIGQALAQVRTIEADLSASIARMLESSQDLGQALNTLVTGSITVSTPAGAAKPAVGVNGDAISLQVLGQMAEQYQQIGEDRALFAQQYTALSQAYQTLARHNASATSIQAVLGQAGMLGEACSRLGSQTLTLTLHLEALKRWTTSDTAACPEVSEVIGTRHVVSGLKHLLSSLNTIDDADFPAY